MSFPSPTTLLAFVSGVGTTVAGSWISSKIHVYQENSRAHLEDIKQKVLIPLSGILSEQYRPLVTHHAFAVVEQWGTRNRRENASVTQDLIDDGPLLLTAAPDLRIGVDSALYLDAKQAHFSKLLAELEEFSEAWQKHVNRCRAWIVRVASEILSKSGMEPFPVQEYGTPNVDHYKLALFLYRRLFCLFERSLNKNLRNPPIWELVGFEGTCAVGGEEQMNSLISTLDELMINEKNVAEELQSEARFLEERLSSLRAEIGYATASRRLRKKCDLVPFF